MSKKKKMALLVLIGILIIIAANAAYAKSLLIMKVYSFFHEQNSIMNQRAFTVDIPGGISTEKKDWYPFVMTFNDNSFYSEESGHVDLTILYNFGAFQGGRSTIYDENSDYYNSFYGAYIIESPKEGEGYGFKGDSIQLDEISAVASHDIANLVLKSVGCLKPRVVFESKGEPKSVDYITYEDWTLMNVNVHMNSCIHQYQENHIAYIQYGKPPKDYSGEDFPDINLSGRMYYRYFSEKDVSILLYVIAPEDQVIEEVDREILSKIKIDVK